MVSSISLFVLLVFSCANLVQNDQNVPFIKILSTECSRKFKLHIANELNDVRSEHDGGYSEYIRFDEELTNYSRKMAIAYAQNGWVGGADLLKNAGLRQPWNTKNYGELSRRLPANESLGDEFGIDPKEVVDYWYGNGDLEPSSGYQWYGSEPTREEAARFAYYTQLIWRSTDRFGVSCVVALNQSDSTKHYQLVLNFYTPPYSVCRFRQNITPPPGTGNPEWEKLRNKVDLGLTEDCQKLRIGQNYCPFGFEDEMLNRLNRMRSDIGNIAQLKMSEKLRVNSQNYANWLAIQAENVTGNQPLSGGNIDFRRYYPDSTDSNHSVILEDNFAFITFQEIVYQQSIFSQRHAFGTEPSDTIKEQCKDFTRALWAGSLEVGIGCAVQWLPELNESRSIVILYFDPPGNVEGRYASNLWKIGG